MSDLPLSAVTAAIHAGAVPVSVPVPGTDAVIYTADSGTSFFSHLQELELDIAGRKETLIVSLRASAGGGVVIVGSVSVTTTRPAADIARLFVPPGFRKQRIGTALMERALELAKAAQCECASLLVQQNNLGVCQFYRKLGFQLAYEFPDGDLMLTKAL